MFTHLARFALLTSLVFKKLTNYSKIKIARYTGTRKRRFRGEEFTMVDWFYGHLSILFVSLHGIQWKTFDDLPGVVGCHQWASIWKNTENLVVRGVLTFTDKLGLPYGESFTKHFIKIFSLRV
jgi:hypothetical protein